MSVSALVSFVTRCAQYPRPQLANTFLPSPPSTPLLHGGPTKEPPLRPSILLSYARTLCPAMRWDTPSCDVDKSGYSRLS